MTSEGLLTNERHVWTDKAGNKLTFKQFISRWKEGMQNVTPIQQIKAQLPSYALILIGVALGLFFSYKSRTWWLFIILLGTLMINSVSLLNLWNRYTMLKKINDEIKESQIQDNNQKEVKDNEG